MEKNKFKTKRLRDFKNILRHRLNFSKKNSCRGQALIFIILLLPILGILILGLGSNLLVLKTKMKQQKICREQTYKAQEEIRSGFMHLKSLNPSALKLRTQLKNALKRLRSAPTPHIHALIVAEIATIKAQQLLLNKQQKVIIQKSKAKAKAQLLKIPQVTSFIKTPFALVARPKLSLSPSYVNPINLTSKQEIIISWKLLTKTNLYKKNLLNIEGKCGSHIKSKGFLYQIKYSYPDIL